MQDRVQVVRPEMRVIARAVQVANRNRGGSVNSSAPAREVTQRGEDENGVIFTIRPAFTDEDSTNDPTTVTTA